MLSVNGVAVNIAKNVMTVIVSPNDSNHSRILKITPTAGDIFSYFSFNQAGKNEYLRSSL